MPAKQLSKQAIFDKVAIHLLTQNQRATSEPYYEVTSCMYRARNGLKCAAGCLLTDSEVTKIGEGNSFGEGYVPYRLKRNASFVHELQCLHDEHYPHEWKIKLLELAARNDLRVGALKEFIF